MQQHRGKAGHLLTCTTKKGTRTFGTNYQTGALVLIRAALPKLIIRYLTLTTRKTGIAAETKRAQRRTGIEPYPSARITAALRLCHLCRIQPSPWVQQSDACSIHEMRPCRMKIYCECNQAQLVSKVVALDKAQWKSSRGSPHCRSPGETFGKAQSKSEVTSVQRTPKEITHSHWAPHLLLPPARMK